MGCMSMDVCFGRNCLSFCFSAALELPEPLDLTNWERGAMGAASPEPGQSASVSHVARAWHPPVHAISLPENGEQLLAA